MLLPPPALLLLLPPPLLPLLVLASTTAPASALASAPAPAPAAAPAAVPRGGGFVVDLPYRMHNNYETGEIWCQRVNDAKRERACNPKKCQVSRVVLGVPPYADRALPMNSMVISQAYRSCSASPHQNQSYS